MASSGGIPNPSYSDGNTNASAFRYRALFSACVTYPVKTTSRAHESPAAVR